MGEISLPKRIKFQKARGYFLNEKSDCYLHAGKALEKAGYAKSTAQTMAKMLFVQSESTPEIRLDPENTAALITELNKWLSLMSKWRKELEQIAADGRIMELDTKVFSTVSTHIERLAKIIGLVKVQAGKGDTNINIQINALPSADQYEKIKAILKVLFGKVRALETELNVDETKRFNLN